MAERRMFSKKIVESDAFLDMPLSTQALYLHLNMEADDDGFVNSPKRIQRMIGASEDDLKLLLAKNFIITFDTGVIVIKHWKLNNSIRKDRYVKTAYAEELNLLGLKENGVYTLNQVTTNVQPSDNQCASDGSRSIGKDSIDKESIVEDSIDICSELENSEPPVITLILNDKTEYGVMQKDIDTYKDLYPAVDVMQELKKMKGWCISNETKRKTRKGIKRFINSWLSTEQDRGGVRNKTPTLEEKTAKINEWSRT